MLDKMASLGKSGLYWLGLVLLGLSFETIALFYQYVIEEMPCALCIQVRLWMAALIIVSLLVMILCRVRFVSLLGHVLTVVIAAGLLDRAYQLLGTERGFAVGDCGFDLGLPAWFSPDKWFPAIFQVETSCGYTPELLFGISMAEALIVFSPLFLLFTVGMTIAAIARLRQVD